VPEQHSDAWLHVAPECRHVPSVVVVVLLVVVLVLLLVVVVFRGLVVVVVVVLVVATLVLVELVVVAVVLVVDVVSVVVVDVEVVVVGGTKSKLPSGVSGDRLPTWSTICTARYTMCPPKPGSPTTSDVPPSWLPRGGVGAAATGVAASNAACVVIGPAREKRKSKRAAVPQ